MRLNRTTSFAIGAVAALVIGSGAAYATTGQPFVLGIWNVAETKTSLENTTGVALRLDPKEGLPPLEVTSGVKAPNLNADRVDGYDGSQLALASGQSGMIRRAGVRIDVDGNGSKDVIVAKASCPPGTRLTGGGYSDVTSDGIVFVNEPFNRIGWQVISTSVENPALVRAWAMCYNPRGTVSGSTFREGPVTLDQATRDLVLARLGR